MNGIPDVTGDKRGDLLEQESFAKWAQVLGRLHGKLNPPDQFDDTNLAPLLSVSLRKTYGYTSYGGDVNGDGIGDILVNNQIYC